MEARRRGSTETRRLGEMVSGGGGGGEDGRGVVRSLVVVFVVVLLCCGSRRSFVSCFLFCCLTAQVPSEAAS